MYSLPRFIQENFHQNVNYGRKKSNFFPAKKLVESGPLMMHVWHFRANNHDKATMLMHFFLKRAVFEQINHDTIVLIAFMTKVSTA